MEPSILTAIESRSKLESVAYVDPAMPSGVLMRFSDGKRILFSVNGDTDEVVVGSEADIDGLACEDATTTVEWASAVGKPILWFWTMKNHQGYRDGVQLQFATDVDEHPVTLQLLAVASTLDVVLVPLT
jgi:hypothetical protein